jgi:small nuclear ribonucleoprotein (snRNP)-like protein
MTVSSETDRYDASILHQPADVDPSGPVARVMALLRKKLRLALKDGRTFVGTFTGYDKFGNFVLTEAEEFFRNKIRRIPMAIIPLNSITAAEVEREPPIEETGS